MNSRISVLFIALAALAGTPAAALAQVGSSTEVIAGSVVGADSVPLEGARIEVTSAETGITKRAVTHADGRFSLLFRDGGGQYRLQATLIGMAPVSQAIQRRGDEDRIVVRITMTKNPQRLAAVEVKGKTSAPQAPGPPAAGSIERNFPPQLLQRLPVNAGDLNAVATLAPGVVAMPGTDSSAASFSVAGQSASQNNKTVDGASFLFGGLPQDAVRSTKVVTNAYDVSRGQFTGGQIATTTKSGTNLVNGTGNYQRRDPTLTYASGPDAGFGQRFGQHTVSGGLGGPILRDRLFYFLSAEAVRRTDPMASLLQASDQTLRGLGASPDSVNSFLATLTRLGLLTSPGASERRTDNFSGLARFDYDLADAHSLMVRGDVRHTNTTGARIAPTALPGAGGSSEGTGLGGLASMTSNFGDVLNEARVSASRDVTNAEPYVRAPAGVVAVTSAGASGERTSTSLLFGGNQALPRSTRGSLMEVADEVSWLSRTAAHRLKLGALFTRDRSLSGAAPNRYGTYVFNSLGDLAAGTPALFARTLSAPERETGSDNAAIYLGDAWRHSASLQVSYGVRIERSTLAQAPARNAAAETSFGLRTDAAPVDVRASPRIGFSYLLGNTIGIPKGFIRGGVGEFRGKIPAQVVSLVRNAPGLLGEQSQLVCAGASIPSPAWNAFAGDTLAIPTECLPTPASVAGAGSQSLPSAMGFASDFAAPRVWRTSLGGARFFTRMQLSFEGTYLRGAANPVARDLNLDAQKFRTADDERPVFASAKGIDARTGAIPLSASRRDANFGSVYELGSGLSSRTTQLTGTVAGNLWRRLFGQVSYTFTRSEDQSSGLSLGGYIPTTRGDPNTVEWGTSDLERRHSVLGILNVPVRSGVELGIIARATSGMPYTPMVNGDVNGDGSRNDRAFIPAAADPIAGSGMQRLLAVTDAAARACLARQTGTIAARNSCTSPWTTTLDAQLTLKPWLAKLNQRLTLSVQALNTTAALDQAIHGAAQVRGWGQSAFPDRTLLFARGFDPSTQRFSYQVNEHFGTQRGAASAFRNPFSLLLQARIAIGTDPAANPFASQDGKGVSVEEWRGRIAPQVPNPLKLLLEQADSLGLALSAKQVANLTARNGAFTNDVNEVITEMATILSNAGPRPDPGSISPKLQAKNERLKTIFQQVVDAIRAELTADQWGKLPERIRLPLAQPAARPSRPDR
ncbi:MAG: carboxypeptidase-like regulatory domain-containing protein [Gemmatimonadaceae bacterium]